MTLLLMHTLVGNTRDNLAGPWAELAAVAVTMGQQWTRRQALLSILLGTALYVLLHNASALHWNI
jgi:branched-subunit amino acid transport protein AzlD